jgi:hypothetical protein
VPDTSLHKNKRYAISKPLTGGKRKIIDETFKDSAKFKDDVEGEITE